MVDFVLRLFEWAGWWACLVVYMYGAKDSPRFARRNYFIFGQLYCLKWHGLSEVIETKYSGHKLKLKLTSSDD